MSDAMATRMAGVIVYSVLARLRLPVAVVTALVVAEAAVFLFRPRAGPRPVEVAPQTYFSAAQLERAEAFRSGQLWLYGARLGIEIGLLVLVVRRPPRRLRGPFRRPLVAGAATAVALSLAVTAATLPVRAIARERARDVGLITQSWAGWAGDVAKGIVIEAVLVGTGGALLLLVMRRTGRHWWAPAAVAIVGFGVVMTYAGPIVLDPLFNKFEPLRRGELRSDVVQMAERAGVQVGEVYVMDASRRTTAANAYVAGHELGHVHYDDVPRGLLYLAIVAPFGMFAVARISERLAPDSLGTPAAVPAVALATGVV